ncbi:MAG: LrgB family protein [Bacteroidaceae bacterium]|nr:LrgB family protein [Bacteroidaceae bacterium]
MKEFIGCSVFWGIGATLIAYIIGLLLKKKFKLFIFNPLLVAIALCIALLAVTGIKYEDYNNGAQHISVLLTPATVCLAIPLYEQLQLLRKNYIAILIGIASGVLTSGVTIFLMSLLFNLNHTQYVTLFPKSITTAIGIGLSQELDGYIAITVAAIMITGLFGNIAGDMLCKILRIKNNVAQGIAVGTASHVMGTSKAMEMGAVQGAMSSLSVAVAGCITVLSAILFENLI